LNSLPFSWPATRASFIPGKLVARPVTCPQGVGATGVPLNGEPVLRNVALVPDIQPNSVPPGNFSAMNSVVDVPSFMSSFGFEKVMSSQC